MRTIFFLLSLVFFSLPAAAAEHYGLAMVGAPKYGPEDTHLDYARPDAPKGGTLKEAAIGTFDTLNPFSIKGKAANGLELTTDRLMARVWDEPFTMYPLIDPDSANSQWFICFDDCSFLNGQYTVWGQVTDGMEHVDAIKRGEPPSNPDKIIKLQVAADVKEEAGKEAEEKAAE